jgi:hypothetical protein
MKWMLRLYPGWWRDRYGTEMAALLDDLPHRSRAAMILDLLRGALDARFFLAKEHTMPSIARGALRRSILIAFVAWIPLFAIILLSNVVFPAKDDDSPAVIALGYLAVFAVLALVGYLAARGGTSPGGLAVCGAVAGAVIGLLIAATFFLVDNIWLDVVARQPQKIAGLAASGGGSMRAYINYDLIGPTIFYPLVLGTFGALLALAGGSVAQVRASRTAG